MVRKKPDIGRLCRKTNSRRKSYTKLRPNKEFLPKLKLTKEEVRERARLRMAKLRAKKNAERAARLEKDRLRMQSLPTTLKLLCYQQNDCDRLKKAERSQQKQRLYAQDSSNYKVLICSKKQPSLSTNNYYQHIKKSYKITNELENGEFESLTIVDITNSENEEEEEDDDVSEDLLENNSYGSKESCGDSSKSQTHPDDASINRVSTNGDDKEGSNSEVESQSSDGHALSYPVVDRIDSHNVPQSIDATNIRFNGPAMNSVNTSLHIPPIFSKTQPNSDSGGTTKSSVGHYIQCKGCKDSLKLCKVINVKDSSDADHVYSGPAKCGVLPSEACKPQGSSRISENVPWKCVFCFRGTSHMSMGDLFGPYVPQQQLSSSNSNGLPAEMWVHCDCAVWTNGIFVAGGRLLGLEEAALAAQHSVCCKCHEKGATLGCFVKGCELKYHYLCACDAGCTLQEENFSILCPKHKMRPVRAQKTISSNSDPPVVLL